MKTDEMFKKKKPQKMAICVFCKNQKIKSIFFYFFKNTLLFTKIFSIKLPLARDAKKYRSLIISVYTGYIALYKCRWDTLYIVHLRNKRLATLCDFGQFQTISHITREKIRVQNIKRRHNWTRQEGDEEATDWP